ncbi:MAG: nitroreductase/quinone reductase family protein [Chloroflexota bacterium]
MIWDFLIRSRERVNPVATFEDNDRLVVIASKGGAPTNPD